MPRKVFEDSARVGSALKFTFSTSVTLGALGVSVMQFVEGDWAAGSVGLVGTGAIAKKHVINDYFRMRNAFAKPKANNRNQASVPVVPERSF